MASEKKSINPFHFLLGLAGIVFTITAVSYWLVILRDEQSTWSQSASMDDQTRTVTSETDPNAQTKITFKSRKIPPANRWFVFLRDNATEVLVWEIGIIAVFTFCAMGLDRYRDIQEDRKNVTKNREMQNIV